MRLHLSDGEEGEECDANGSLNVYYSPKLWGNITGNHLGCTIYIDFTPHNKHSKVASTKLFPPNLFCVIDRKVVPSEISVL